MSTEPQISVVVPSYRPGVLLERCVERLLQQRDIGAYEVVVVDSSADGTAERLRARFPRCHVIGLPTRTSQAVARNLGLASSRGKFVAFTDHDCLVPPHWLAGFLARHAGGNYAAVGGAVANGTPRSLVGTAAYWIEFNDFTPRRPAGPIAGVPHCNICFRRDALPLPDPFPLVPPAAEDLAFNHLLVRSGGTIYFDPGIIVTHVNRTSLRAYLVHQRVLGEGSAVARRLVPLAGRVFVRQPVMTPLLPFVRLAGTIVRVARRDPGHLPIVLVLLPLLLPGYAAWTSGFVAGCRATIGVDGWSPVAAER